MIAFILCVSLVLAASSASRSGIDEEAKVHALTESEAVMFEFEDEFDGAIAHRAEEIRIWAATIKANEEAEAARQAEAARRAQEEAQAQAERKRQEAAQRATQAPIRSTYSGGGDGDPNNPATWDRLAQCESGGNWSINTGNGYSGGLQFHPQTWTGHGGGQYAQYAYQATREQQIEIGKRVQASQGWAAWPACTRSFGWR